MSEVDGKVMQKTDDKQDRRSFMANISKCLLGVGAFFVASALGAKANGEIRLGKMKDVESGRSEGYGKCGFNNDCSGGGGGCGFNNNCSGGGGKCGFSNDCSGGGGKCGFNNDCSGR